MSIALRAENLEKRYGDFVAVRNLSFSVGTGEVLGLIGPNGAGKTSTIRMLAGYAAPSSGRVSILGLDLAAAPKRVRRALGYLPENVPLYPDLRVEEYVDHRARLKGLRGRARKGRVAAALDRLALTAVRGQLVGTLSKGFRQRVGLAAVLVNRPPVVILDEPTIGLDPLQTRDLRGVIEELREEHTIVISSHILSELEKIVDRVLLLYEGQRIAEGPPEELRKKFDRPRVDIEVRGDTAPFVARLRSLDAVAAVEVVPAEDGGWDRVIVTSHGDCRAAIAECLRASDLAFRELHAVPHDLEATFDYLITKAEAEGDA